LNLPKAKIDGPQGTLLVHLVKSQDDVDRGNGQPEHPEPEGGSTSRPSLRPRNLPTWRSQPERIADCRGIVRERVRILLTGMSVRTTELFVGVGVDAGDDNVLSDSHLFPQPNNDLFSKTDDESFAETRRKKVLLRKF